jgi:hypothetical protein
VDSITDPDSCASSTGATDGGMIGILPGSWVRVVGRRDQELTMGRTVEIGSLREPVEILDEPLPPPEERIGRIKHRNGENATINFETLQELMSVAREARQAAMGGRKFSRRDRLEDDGPLQA